LALTGELPAASSCQRGGYLPNYTGRHVTAIRTPSDQPDFEFVFGTEAAPDRGPRLSVTLTAGPGTPSATVAWRCGSAPIALQMASLAEDHSTLPWRGRPSSCREPRADAAR
jgi:hypothetical protein